MASSQAKPRNTPNYVSPPQHASWVATEKWQDQQAGSFDKEGFYILKFDYNQDPELIMDILKHGSGVEVMEPASLKSRVKAELEKTLASYR